jgi:hypothetical protein
MRLFCNNKFMVNVCGLSEYGLMMKLCEEGKKISRHTHTGKIWHI